MATITVDGRQIEAPDGAPLLEVLRKHGFYVSSLCYIEGLPPYAGCRTCLVEIEGARGLQLSCTSRVQDGMTVRTSTEEVREARKAVMSIILANHSDRCLTCHRREHCHPGDICLRDDVITHRCVTCPKNYRCELQTTSEVVGMALYEPWEGEPRSFYAMEEHPPADQANPFLEFDPKMCILCTRCVRACDEIRHTGAITLSGRGFETRIAFGAGGPVHESNCDFCGACIDVCPTATLLEHPHKWVAKPERWVPTVCSYCSVGCTIKLGVKDGRGVIVRPDQVNPVSRDQICVRGRFHYDALKPREYLSRPQVRRGDLMAPVSWEEALEQAAAGLAEVVQRHGPDAVAFLVSPLSTNEEAYLAQKLARTVVGTNSIDFTAGAVARATAEAVRRAFGTEALPADLTQLERSNVVVAVGDDIEASHTVAALRIKDAVVRNQAALVVVSPRWNELCDFARVWLRPAPGHEAATVDALARALLADEGVRQRLAAAGVSGLDGAAPGAADVDGLDQAAALLREAAAGQATVSVVYAPSHVGAVAAGHTAAAAANLALAACGAEGAPRSLFILPTDVNVNGLRELGATPEYLPGFSPAGDAVAREALARAWGAPLAETPGLTAHQALAAAAEGRVKALVVVGDNPLMLAPQKAAARRALESLDLLVVIDAVRTDTAALAHVLLPDADTYAKGGTFTQADRRVLLRHPATRPVGEARPAFRILVDLAGALAPKLGRNVSFPYEGPKQVMEEIATILPHYARARYGLLAAGRGRQVLPEAGQEAAAAVQEVPRPASGGEGFALLTSRTLYTSLEAAAIHHREADKLHREEFAEVNVEDAAELGIQDGDQVVLSTPHGELAVPAKATDAVPRGVVFVPLLYDGGAVTALLGPEGTPETVPPVRLAVRSAV